MGIFYQEKSISRQGKIGKNDFTPSEKYSSYAPDVTVQDVFSHFFPIFGQSTRLIIWQSMVNSRLAEKRLTRDTLSPFHINVDRVLEDRFFA